MISNFFRFVKCMLGRHKFRVWVEKLGKSKLDIMINCPFCDFCVETRLKLKPMSEHIKRNKTWKHLTLIKG